MAGRGDDPAVLHRKAQTAILSALASGGDGVLDLVSAVAPYDVRHHFTPDVALLEIAAAALGLACPPASEPLEYEGLTDRHLPDQELTGRSLRQRTHYAVHAAACLRGGLLPDLLREAGGWEPRLRVYAVSAVVLYSRAAGERPGSTVPEIAATIADGLGVDLSAARQSSP